jgi:hypothetical protein
MKTKTITSGRVELTVTTSEAGSVVLHTYEPPVRRGRGHRHRSTRITLSEPRDRYELGMLLLDSVRQPFTLVQDAPSKVA